MKYLPLVWAAAQANPDRVYDDLHRDRLFAVRANFTATNVLSLVFAEALALYPVAALVGLGLAAGAFLLAKTFMSTPAAGWLL